MKEKIVCIDWDDACYNSGIFDRANTKRYEQLKTKTVGQVIETNSKCVIIGMDSWLDENGNSEYRHITTIPRKMIRRIVTLKES